MRLRTIAAALVAATLAAAPALGGTQDHELVVGTLQLSCMSERQKCLEKLESWLHPVDGKLDPTRVESALLQLHETDPECALLLQGSGHYGF